MLHPMRDTLQPLPTYTIHKGWEATDRVRKIRLKSPVAWPKREASAWDEGPIHWAYPFEYSGYLTMAQVEGPTRLIQMSILDNQEAHDLRTKPRPNPIGPKTDYGKPPIGTENRMIPGHILSSKSDQILSVRKVR